MDAAAADGTFPPGCGEARRAFEAKLSDRAERTIPDELPHPTLPSSFGGERTLLVHFDRRACGVGRRRASRAPPPFACALAYGRKRQRGTLCGFIRIGLHVAKPSGPPSLYQPWKAGREGTG